MRKLALHGEISWYASIETDKVCAIRVSCLE